MAERAGDTAKLPLPCNAAGTAMSARTTHIVTLGAAAAPAHPNRWNRPTPHLPAIHGHRLEDAERVGPHDDDDDLRGAYAALGPTRGSRLQEATYSAQQTWCANLATRHTKIVHELRRTQTTARRAGPPTGPATFVAGSRQLQNYTQQLWSLRKTVTGSAAAAISAHYAVDLNHRIDAISELRASVRTKCGPVGLARQGGFDCWFCIAMRAQTQGGRMINSMVQPGDDIKTAAHAGGHSTNEAAAPPPANHGGRRPHDAQGLWPLKPTFSISGPRTSPFRLQGWPKFGRMRAQIGRIRPNFTRRAETSRVKPLKAASAPHLLELLPGVGTNRLEFGRFRANFDQCCPNRVQHGRDAPPPHKKSKFLPIAGPHWPCLSEIGCRLQMLYPRSSSTTDNGNLVERAP